MATPRISPETHAAIVRCWSRGIRSHRRINRETGAHWQTIARVLRAEGLMGNRGDGKPTPGTAPSPTTFSRSESADSALVEYTSDERIRTLEDALKYGEVDTTVWMVDRWETSSWEVVLKVKKDGQDVPLRKNLWRVKLYLKRLLPKALQDGINSLFDRMKGYAPSYPPITQPRLTSAPHLLELGLVDSHFGKLAWSRETGQDYDLRIAEQVFRNAVVDLMDCVRGYEIDQICIPLGNDFLHVDNAQNTTTGGTPQDVDGRLPKIYVTAFNAFIWAVEYAMQTAPVKVLLVRGNHDHTTSYFLAHAVAVWFRNSDRVTVDYSPKTRKYIRYGNCLIGYTHGNEEPVKSLPGLMAQEERKAWGETQHQEWRRGHWHKSKTEMTTPVDTHDGVVVRTIRSLSAIDCWHYKKGFGGPRAAECFLMCKESGFRGQFNVNVRES